ncbi:MAG TPA: D-alanine--D-alanine ligase [Vicinamibacterales bacterium]|nr:D-alanine--D-alanine ligase [Vicinamibacterales bacterium]
MRIAVLFGGVSEERDVSIASGAQVVRALTSIGHDVIAVDTARGALPPEEHARLMAMGVAVEPPSSQTLSLVRRNTGMLVRDAPELRQADVVFIALHGGSGEDGTIQALFDLAGIPYTGTGHLASAYAMDKDVAKRLFRSARVPTPDWLMAPVDTREVIAALGFPVIVKPNKQGSSVGLTVVDDHDALSDAIDRACRYDDEVMVERFVAGRELTVGVLEGRALVVGEIRPRLDAIFDYASKYQPDGADEIFPADLSDETTTLVRDLAVRAHHAVKAGSYSRVDFRLDDAGQPWCLEVNTVPGMTATSLLPQSAKAAGLDFPRLCERLCEIAQRERGQKPSPCSIPATTIHTD